VSSGFVVLIMCLFILKLDATYIFTIFLFPGSDLSKVCVFSCTLFVIERYLYLVNLVTLSRPVKHFHGLE
jgi:hypothetical protein